MGASVSAGHSSHSEHSAGFKRVGSGNRTPSSRCRMCQLNVDVGDAAYYRCSEPDCAVVLHESCYRRPKKLKKGHFAHPQHRLKLGGDTTRAGLPCSICAQKLGTPPVAYSCTKSRSRCAGFHAHPRYCSLPPYMIAQPELKREHSNLVLRNGGCRPRRCLKCNNWTAATGSVAWSYQCSNSKCYDVEYCLGCVLGNDDDGRPPRCYCFPCCDVDPAVVHCLGYLAGVFCCAFLSGMGCPGILTTRLSPGDMELNYQVAKVTGNQQI